MTTTGILLFDDVEELDFAGPWEVLTVARREGDVVVTVAEKPDLIRCGQGLRVMPDHTFADCPPLDVIVVPGGQGPFVELENPVLMSWLAEVSAQADWVTSVCTGTLLHWGTGVAKGRTVTTHSMFVEGLRAMGDITVVDDRALGRRRQPRHRGRGVGRHRHGAVAGRPDLRRGARPLRPARDRVRPGTAVQSRRLRSRRLRTDCEDDAYMVCETLRPLGVGGDRERSTRGAC